MPKFKFDVGDIVEHTREYDIKKGKPFHLTFYFLIQDVGIKVSAITKTNKKTFHKGSSIRVVGGDNDIMSDGQTYLMTKQELEPFAKLYT